MIHRVAIIGAGIGAQHLTAYRQLPDRYSVTTICDLDTARARSILEADDAIQIESDLDSVLGNDAIDLVDICLPPHLHFDVAMKALAANKHVVCEKPLVTSLRDADRLIERLESSDRILSPVFQYRFGPALDQLKALIASGLAGKPLVANLVTHWNRQSDYYAVPWRGTWAGEQGGALLGHAIHAHDLLGHIFGPVQRLSAFATTRVNPIEVEDCAAISFQMANGALATSSVTLGGAEDISRISFVFENLTAESDTLPYTPAEGQWRFTARGATTQQQVDACLAQVSTQHSGFAGYLAALSERLSGDGKDAVTVEDGRRSLELVSAIYHAVRSGTVVELPLPVNHPRYDGWQPAA